MNILENKLYIIFHYKIIRYSHIMRGCDQCIYKSKDLMQKIMRFCQVVHFMKKIEIFLNHIKDKNKFKNRDSLFPLIQCFKTTFCYILVNISKLLFVSFGSMFQDFSSLLHTQDFLHLHSPFSLLLLYIHMPTTLNVISSQIHSNKK